MRSSLSCFIYLVLFFALSLAFPIASLFPGSLATLLLSRRGSGIFCDDAILLLVTICSLQGEAYASLSQGRRFEKYCTPYSTPPRIRRRMNRRALIWSAFLPFIILSSLLLDW